MEEQLKEPTEIERARPIVEKELARSNAYLRLKENSDFSLYLSYLQEKLNSYRDLLEDSSTEKIDTVRGGIIAVREVLAEFELAASRVKELEQKLKELK